MRIENEEQASGGKYSVCVVMEVGEWLEEEHGMVQTLFGAFQGGLAMGAMWPWLGIQGESWALEKSLVGSLPGPEQPLASMLPQASPVAWEPWAPAPGSLPGGLLRGISRKQIRRFKILPERYPVFSWE